MSHCDFLLPQSEWFPLTYGHHKNAPFPQKPLDIKKEGYRDAFTYQTIWRGRKLEKKITGLAFRSGTGTSVALSISTVNHDLHWDFVPINDKEMRWYCDQNLSDNERQMKGFTELVGTSSKPIEETLLALVVPRSCGASGQGSKEWFLDRMFSATSSQIHFLIHAAAPLLISNGDDVKESLRVIVEFTKHKGVNLADQPAEQENSTTDPNSNQNEEEKEEEKCEKQQEAEDFIEKLTSLDPQVSQSDNDFLADLSSVSNETLSWMLHLLQKSSPPLRDITRANSVKKINTWIKSPRSHRLLCLQTKTQLQAIAAKKRITVASNANKTNIIEKIVEKSTEREDNTATSPDLFPLVAILKQSFLRPQQPRSERLAAQIGHRNEEKFLNEFFSLYTNKEFSFPDGSNDLLPLKVIFRPGLVAHKQNRFMKDSADGVVVLEGNVSCRDFFSFV